MIHLKYQTICGWKGHLKNSFVEKEVVRITLSFLTALVIVFIVGKILGLLDLALQDRYFSYNGLFSVSAAQAAGSEGFKMIQSHRQINILKNKGFTFTVGFKNNGTNTWSKDGNNKVVIKAVGNSNPLRHSFWSADGIAGKMSDNNPRGYIGYFPIAIQTPNTSGIFEQTFALYKGKTKISDDFTVAVNSWDSEAEVKLKKRLVTDETQEKIVEKEKIVNTSVVATASEPIIRLGLFSNEQPQVINSSGVYNLVDLNNKVLLISSAQITIDYIESTGQYMYSTNNQQIIVNGYLRIVPQSSANVFEIITFENRPGWNQKLNDNKFLGNLEIRYSAKTNKTWLINELPMEDYLRGLAEVTNDAPVEYQKTMIIAARTYALHHLQKNTKHADEFYTLDTVNDQVYKGYGLQTRQKNVVAAVEATRSQVVTYNGEIAITPYFSWSDGRTRSMKEVWNSDKPWLQSVVEPAGYDKTTLFGHGVGLSARGALLLARDQNYSAEQILKYYYLGINLTNNYNH